MSTARYLILVSGITIAEVRAKLAEQQTSHGQNESTRKKTRDRATLATPCITDFATYADIPSSFLSAHTHPRKTNLLCWHCALPFETVPRFIALESTRAMDGDTLTFRWSIHGNFCSWSCAAAYIDDMYAQPKKYILQQNLAQVRAQFDGGRVLSVMRAPPRTSIKSYCGNSGMSQQDFVAQVSKASPVPN
jgi:hypothetical protein